VKRRTLIKSGLACGVAYCALGNAAEGGVSGNDLLLGQSAVLSGPLGQTLRAFGRGMQLAFDESNGAGGVHGRKVKLLSLDDELKPQKAVANYTTLLNDRKVLAMVAGVGSATTAAAEPLLRESGAPLFAAYGVSDAVREKTKGAAYYARATYRREVEALLQHLATIGIGKIALVHLDYPGGHEIRTLTETVLAARGQRLQIALPLANDGKDARDCAARLAATGPQAVVMFLGAVPATALMEAVWATQLRPSFYGMSVVGGDEVAKLLGARARGLAISQTMSYPWSDTDSVAREFRRHCEAAAAPVDYVSFEGYLSANLILEACRRAGPNVSRANLHSAIRSLKLRYAGMEFDFTSGDPTGSRYVELVQIGGDGRIVR
jgi:branched-chain amino acid transport system substrate-binding protein